MKVMRIPINKSFGFVVVYIVIVYVCNFIKAFTSWEKEKYHKHI